MNQSEKVVTIAKTIRERYPYLNETETLRIAYLVLKGMEKEVDLVEVRK
jgi:hypothetical protein